MKAHVYEHRDGRMALGLLVGAVVGAGLAMWFAPRMSELRQRLRDSPILRDHLAEADADSDAAAIARAADDGARDYPRAAAEPAGASTAR
jgi:gas vesicle protein